LTGSLRQNGKFAAINERFAAVEEGIKNLREEMRREIGGLRSGIYQFSEVLLNTLVEASDIIWRSYNEEKREKGGLSFQVFT
jgi:hypothetical protein